MQAGGVQVSPGDVRCLANGHHAMAINALRGEWDADRDIEARLAQAGETLQSLYDRLPEAAGAEATGRACREGAPEKAVGALLEAAK